MEFVVGCILCFLAKVHRYQRTGWDEARAKACLQGGLAFVCMFPLSRGETLATVYHVHKIVDCGSDRAGYVGIRTQKEQLFCRPIDEMWH